MTTGYVPPDAIATVHARPAPPAGHEYRWVVCVGWRISGAGSRNCRRSGPGRIYCDRVAVAALAREQRVHHPTGTLAGEDTTRVVWWHYCDHHLYGRIVLDGNVLELRPVPVTEPLGPGDRTVTEVDHRLNR